MSSEITSDPEFIFTTNECSTSREKNYIFNINISRLHVESTDSVLFSMLISLIWLIIIQCIIQMSSLVLSTKYFLTRHLRYSPAVRSTSYCVLGAQL
jgi:hypothetical protein